MSASQGNRLALPGGTDNSLSVPTVELLMRTLTQLSAT